MVLLLVAEARAACAPDALLPALDRAESSIADSDRAALARALADAEAAAGCADPSAWDAARLHRARGLAHALAGEHDDARIDFRAANAAHPLIGLPPELAVAGAASDWAVAQEDPLAWGVGPEAVVNGVRTGLRPDAPVLRPVRPGGAMRWGALVAAGVAGAAYGGAWAARAGYEARVSDPIALDRMVARRQVVNGLAVGSVAAGSIAVGMFAASWTL